MWSGARSASSSGLAEVREVPGGSLAVAGVGDSVTWLRGDPSGVSGTEARQQGSFAMIERSVDHVFIRCWGDALVLIRSTGGTVRCLRDCQQRRELASVDSAVLVVGVAAQVEVGVLESWLAMGAAPWVVENLVGADTEHALVLVEAWSASEDLGAVGDLVDLEAASFLEGGVLEEIQELPSALLPADRATPADEIRTRPRGTIPPPELRSDTPVGSIDRPLTAPRGIRTPAPRHSRVHEPSEPRVTVSIASTVAVGQGPATESVVTAFLLISAIGLGTVVICLLYLASS